MFVKNKKIISFTLAVLIVLIFVAVALFPGFKKWQQSNSKSSVTLKINGTAKQGNVVNIDVNIDTHGRTINAAEVYLDFDPKSVQVKSLDKRGSFFRLWIINEPKFSNKSGVISFAGGLPTPGFKGSGKIGSIQAKLIKSGKTQITFDKKSRMLLNDGLGTATPLRMAPIRFTIK